MLLYIVVQHQKHSITSAVVSMWDVRKIACPKLTSFAKHHIEVGCCVVQAPSKGRVRSEGRKKGRKEGISHWSLHTTPPFE